MAQIIANNRAAPERCEIIGYCQERSASGERER